MVHVKNAAAESSEEQQFLYECRSALSIDEMTDAILGTHALQSHIQSLALLIRQRLLADPSLAGNPTAPFCRLLLYFSDLCDISVASIACPVCQHGKAAESSSFDHNLETRPAFKFAEQAFAGSGPCALARPPRGLLSTEWELVRMSGDSKLGLEGRLLEWWSPGEEGVIQFGSAANSSKEVGSGRFPT
ncbi:hypothetical protein BHM03_00012419 [Ensete ventricosum]|nr:hypothetical protein BHM03_00012419 [Ensete ventricosum]